MFEKLRSIQFIIRVLTFKPFWSFDIKRAIVEKFLNR
jgi:hypothetical protein